MVSEEDKSETATQGCSLSYGGDPQTDPRIVTVRDGIMSCTKYVCHYCRDLFLIHFLHSLNVNFHSNLPVLVLHTSASLALNESWDPDVRDDMEMMLNKIVPEGLPYRHSCEGPDDMVIIQHQTNCFTSKPQL